MAEPVSDVIDNADLPDGWIVKQRCATWIVATYHDTEFVFNGGTIRLTAGDAIGCSRHILASDGASTAESLNNGTLIDRAALVCEILDRAVADRLDAGVVTAATAAFTDGSAPDTGSGVDVQQATFEAF